MKVTVVCEFYGKRNQGTAIATMNLIDYLKEKGHQVTIVSSAKDTQGKDGFYVLEKLNFGKFINGVLERNNVDLSKLNKNMLKNAIKGADIVYLNFPFTPECFAAKTASELNIPLVAGFHCQAENVTSHFGLMNCKLVNKKIYKAFYKKMYQYCDMIHFPTEFIKDTFETNIKKTVPASVISNGVNDDFFREVRTKKADKFTILCSGRYSKEKSQEDLLKAVGISKYKDKIKITLAGSGPRLKYYKKLIKKYGLDCEMKFFTRKELIDVMHSAHLYVHTSVAEIEAIACMEAIVSGLVPVICNSKESATRYFAVDDGVLFGKHDYKALKDRIEYFYENPNVLEEYAQRYASRKDAFRLGECMERMEKMMLDTIENKKNGN